MFFAALLLLASMSPTPALSPETTCPQQDLLLALNDADEDIRFLAAYLMEGEDAGPETVAALTERMLDADEKPRVRRQAATTFSSLAKHGRLDPTTPLLALASREDAPWRVRSTALDGLWSMDEGRTLTSSLATLSSGLQLTVDGVAVRFPGRDPESLDRLAGLLQHGDPEARRLGVLGLHSAGYLARAHEDALLDAALHDPNHAVQQRALVTLEGLGATSPRELSMAFVQEFDLDDLLFVLSPQGHRMKRVIRILTPPSPSAALATATPYPSVF
jgi:hypothetical protein